jgi:hypothetical protein
MSSQAALLTKLKNGVSTIERSALAAVEKQLFFDSRMTLRAGLRFFAHAGINRSSRRRTRGQLAEPSATPRLTQSSSFSIF